jgi:hypothetical protein
MAQGTPRSKSGAKSANSRAQKSSGGSRGARGGGGSRSAGGTRARTAAAAKQRSTSRSSDGKGAVGSAKDAVGTGARSAKDTVVDGVQTTGDAVSTVAKKVKGPAVAGGAALVGLAGGLAIASRANGPRKLLGVPVPGTRRPLVKITTPKRVKARGATKDLRKAATEVGTAGRQVGDLVTEVRRVRTELERGQRRSPLEIVLEGLTSRRGQS